MERIDHWEELAECRDMDTDIFFPERGEPNKEAKAACGRCVVRETCLTENLEMKVGVWGGLSERERRAERRRRRLDGTL